MGTFYGRVELDEGIFLVSVGELTFFIGGWVWLEVYFQGEDLDGHFFTRMSISGGGWTFILAGWGG